MAPPLSPGLLVALGLTGCKGTVQTCLSIAVPTDTDTDDDTDSDGASALSSPERALPAGPSSPSTREAVKQRLLEDGVLPAEVAARLREGE